MTEDKYIRVCFEHSNKRIKFMKDFVRWLLSAINRKIGKNGVEI